MDEWINKVWYIHTMEYCLATKSNKQLIHTATWMDPKGIMLSEKCQSQKIVNYMIPFILHPQTDKNTVMKSRSVVDGTETG